MKKMKKLVSIMLALVMAVAMSVTAFAGTGSSTIKITNVPSDAHTFTAYQIFDGDLDADGKLSNITWGDGVTSNALAAAKSIEVNGDYPFTDCTTAADVAAVLENADAETVTAFAEKMATVLSTSSGSSSTGVADNGAYTYTISGVDVGYYLVTDSTTKTEEDAVSAYILYVAGDTSSIEFKNETVTIGKKILEGTDEMKGTSASAGQTVTFELTGTVPDADTLSKYDTYAYTFHDTLSSNLTYVSGSVEVTVDGVTVSPSCYTIVIDPSDGCSLHVVFADILTLTNTSGGSINVADADIVVTYNATLDAGAVAGTEETNDVFIEYSNNPNGSGTGKTTTDKVYVYTFDLTVDKTDANGNALSGAAFTLYKADADGSITLTINGTDGQYTQVGSETAAAANGDKYTAAFSDLGAGSYVLVETTTPNGYNTIDPIAFTITATYNTDGTIDTLTCDNKDVTATVSTGILSTTVINNGGTALPTTGGIGTTVFYIVGGVIVLGAVVLIITRRRMRSV